jgi:hypothetical protein
MRGVLRASGKAVWTWPPVGAVDAGPMQIQWWEGAAPMTGYPQAYVRFRGQ